MDPTHRDTFEHLQGLADDEGFDASCPNAANFVNMGGVLDGSERIELSHVGGEFNAGSLEQDIEDDTDDEGVEAKKKCVPYSFSFCKNSY